MSKPNYITINRLRKLAEMLEFLETHTNTQTVVGESLDAVDIDRTALLKEIAQLNIRRFELMQTILA